jgi:hypothetical protein
MKDVQSFLPDVRQLPSSANPKFYALLPRKLKSRETSDIMSIWFSSS